MASPSFDLLEQRQVEYVLVGGIAMLVYVEGRNTQVIDLIVSRKDLAKLPEIRIEDENSEFARGWLDQLRIDFLFTENKLFDKIVGSYTSTKQFADRQVPCASVEAILLLKLFALPSLHRQGKFEKVDLYENDVKRLMREYKPNLAPLLEELTPHLLASDLEEIKKIVEKIDTEITESQQRFRG